MSTPPPNSSTVFAQRVQAARAVKNDAADAMLDKPNVTAVGIGYKNGDKTSREPAIIVSVERKVPLGELREMDVIPPVVNGVQTDVVVSGPFRAFAQTERLRPARPGISLGNVQITAGTFGCVVSRAGTKLILSNNHVLAEGAQAVLLDIDHGTYPFVTSSNATIGGVMTGLGVPPQQIGRVVGMAKSFCTRVGAGPFVTELQGDLALRLRGSGANPWDEYGATTGRARRVGWFDAVALRYAVQMNGITELALTKLDILSGLEALRICVAYSYKGERLDDFPQDSEVLAKCEPIYEDVPGWREDVQQVRAFESLPQTTHDYIARIEQLGGARVSIASVGPEREQLVFR